MVNQFTLSANEDLKMTICTAASGDITFHDIAGNIKEYYNRKPTKNSIWDFSRSNTDKLTNNEIRDLAELTSKLELMYPSGKGCVALVVSKALAYGLSRMFASNVEKDQPNQKFRVFYSYEEAFKWISETEEKSDK